MSGRERKNSSSLEMVKSKKSKLSGGFPNKHLINARRQTYAILLVGCLDLVPLLDVN